MLYTPENLDALDGPEDAELLDALVYSGGNLAPYTYRKVYVMIQMI